MTQGENDEVEQPGTEQQADTTDKIGKEEAKQTDETVEAEEEQDTTEAGDDSEGEETTEDAGEAEEEPAKPISRAQARIRRQADELKTERAEKEKLIADRAVALAQLENLRTAQQNAQSEQQRVAEEQRLALLDPQERAAYQSSQQIRNLEYRLNQMQIQQTDNADRANFQAKATYDEVYAKNAEKVEDMYQDGLRRGVHASREDLLAYQLGKELLKDKNSKIAKKKEIAGKRIDSVTTKPANAKGDVAGTKKGRSEEDRLRGVLI